MRHSEKTDPETGQRYVSVDRSGGELLLNPATNKGTAFTARERVELGLKGLLPPAVSTVEQQLQRTYDSFQGKPTYLEKFIYLSSLHDHIEEMMPIVYTPVVDEACQKFSHLYRRARGLFVSYDQRDDIDRILANCGTKNPSVMVVTDGERILGLGDQGIGGMGIPIGKLCLYTLCAGLPPQGTLPIMLDVGTNNAERLADPLYLGLRHERITGDAYQTFVDAFVDAIGRTFPGVLLQWEDLHKDNAMTQLKRFRDTLCSFNDDIQGTASVVLAGILASSRITGQQLRDQRIVLAGAGAAAQGIADLFVAALEHEGVARDEARRRIWMVDSRGLVATGSPFAPVDFDGRRHRVGQSNNAFIFPGVGLGIWVAQARRVTDAMFMDAAKALAEQVTAEDLEEGALYPSVRRIRDCSYAVACAVVRRAVEDGDASEVILEDLEDTVRQAMWFPEYVPIRSES